MTTSGDSSPRKTAPADDATLVALMTSARAGDQLAWSRLVRRLEPGLRRVVRPCRLTPADVDDVLQSTWTLLYCNIAMIRDPAAVTGWLATTARRQALRLLQQHTSELLTDELEYGLVADGTPESLVLEGERRETFLRALGSLTPRQRRLVTLLAAQPALDYAQVGSLLAMSVGSIGPTRARALERLERDDALRAVVMTA
ncbi:MAG: hypothetical protein QOJ35_2396 [Solirubrobacteraceae bacterium]|jgi:RNA polymerase sigma factor (sigma-70 family)|nr:hypothetical protein [Solirubrobacteraceae bacterium]